MLGSDPEVDVGEVCLTGGRGKEREWLEAGRPARRLLGGSAWRQDSLMEDDPRQKRKITTGRREDLARLVPWTPERDEVCC